MKNKEGKEVSATLIPVAPGAKVELFRVYYLGDNGIRVEIQGFNSREPMDMGSILAQVADVLADAMAKLLEVPGEETPSREAMLGMIVGSMVAMLVQPLAGPDIDTSFEPAPFRGEPSKKGH